MKFLITILTSVLLHTATVGQTVIQMQKIGGRTYQVDCKVNGLKLNFTLDTGADVVTISLKEALFMLEKGYLSEMNLLNTEYYELANGEITEGTKIILDIVEIGDVVIRNVQASIVHSMEAPLLFGQSALEKLGKISIDYQNNQLIIGDSNVIHATPKGSALDYFLSGNRKFHTENYAEAIADYSKSINVDGSISETYYNRACAKMEVLDYSGAMTDYNKAISLNPNYVQALTNRGELKGINGDYYGSLNDFNKAISLNSQYWVALNNRGYSHQKLQNYQKAIDDYNRALRLNSEESGIYDNRAYCKFSIGDQAGAIRDMDKAIQLSPRNHEYYYRRGIMKGKAGLVESACRDWYNAKNLGSYEAADLLNRFCN